METNQTGPKKKIKFSWWLWVILVVAVVGVATSFIAKPNKQALTQQKIAAKKDTPQEINIKQNISSLRGDIVRYYESKQTYAGWIPSQATQDIVKKAGSAIKTQALSATGYMIFAKMPNSKLTFCMDRTGFTGEVLSVSGLQKTCQ